MKTHGSNVRGSLSHITPMPSATMRNRWQEWPHQGGAEQVMSHRGDLCSSHQALSGTTSSSVPQSSTLEAEVKTIEEQVLSNQGHLMMLTAQMAPVPSVRGRISGSPITSPSRASQTALQRVFSPHRSASPSQTGLALTTHCVPQLVAAHRVERMSSYTGSGTRSSIRFDIPWASH